MKFVLWSIQLIGLSSHLQLYKILPSPTTLEIKPGESQNVLFKIIGGNNTDLPSTAIFNFIPNNDINKNNIKININ